MTSDTPPPKPAVVVTDSESRLRYDNAKAALEVALKTPHCVRRLREAAPGTARKIADSDARISDMLREQEARAEILQAETKRLKLPPPTSPAAESAPPQP